MNPLIIPTRTLRSSTLCASCRRTFSATSTRSASLQWDRNDPAALAASLPEYPYGSARWYKQSNLGLYGGTRIRFGNNVGTKIAVKTRRSWSPNVLSKRLWSQALGRSVQLRVTARVLRTIDKLGGLDEYLLGEKEGRIKELGESGWWLRWAVMQTNTIRKRFAAERVRLGLPDQITAEEEAAVAAAQQDIEAPTETSAPEQVVTTLESQDEDELPPLKFRVDNGKHVVLSPEHGQWIRTRPDRNVLDAFKQSKLVERFVRERLPYLMGQFTDQLNLDTEQSRLGTQEDITRLRQEIEGLRREIGVQRRESGEAAESASLEGKARVLSESQPSETAVEASDEDVEVEHPKLSKAPTKLQKLERQLKKLLASQIRAVDRAELLKQARREFMRRFRAEAEMEYQRRQEVKEGRKTERRERKSAGLREKRAAAAAESAE